MHRAFPSRAARPTSLAACLAAALALSAPLVAGAATWTVDTCSEANSGSGSTGSLRYAVANAASGDTIDLTQLACSTISLHTGAIAVTQDTLVLQGPGVDALEISGRYNGSYQNDRIITHSGTGTLSILGMSIAYGQVSSTTGDVLGGCIYSAGTLSLRNARVSDCHASTTASGALAFGGAIASAGPVSFAYVDVRFSDVTSATGPAFGGGVAGTGGFSAKYSTFDANAARGPQGTGGGIVVIAGSSSLSSSTVSRNFATYGIGGLMVQNGTLDINNSTISGNSADVVIGGLFTPVNTHVWNSTIAFNTAEAGTLGGHAFAPGMVFQPASDGTTLELQSTLLSGNTYGTSENDFSVGSPGGTFTISGANNLVRATFETTLPADTQRFSCPQLGPLRDNGGPTWTHALLSGSPAIDAGNNAYGKSIDQRGTFAFPAGYARVSGVAADIGAYEVQQDDVVFATGLDGCPVLF
jgi:hypothetical protein